MKLPVGIQDFKKLRLNGYTYIDKTELVYRMANNGEIYFLSRPRRFGKSLLMSTLRYYFQGERELFKGLAIEQLEKDWVKYPVFHIDFNGNNYTDPNALLPMLEAKVAEWENAYGFAGNTALGVGERFKNFLAHVHATTGKKSVVLIDEYDKPMLDVLDSDLMAVQPDGQQRKLEDHNREILKAFYSTFKAADADLRFVLLTGVTKFSQVSVFSGFNQPEDISLSFDYEALCGITEEEIHTALLPAVERLAETLGKNIDDTFAALKRQYDGYHFSPAMTDVYNPFSVLSALKQRQLRNFWFSTGTPTYLIRLLNRCNERIDELTGRYYRAEEFIDYKADTERPLPMIYQSGYLTIKHYDEMTDSFQLDFPNNEVRQGFLAVLASSYLAPSSGMVVPVVIQLVHALHANDLDTFRTTLTAFFADIPYSMRRKDTERERERYFHYAFYLIFRLMSTYLVLTEKQQSQGRADCIIETPSAIYIFEFKLDGTPADALRQIGEKGYARPYTADARPVIAVGADFSSETGTIDGWEVKSIH